VEVEYSLLLAVDVVSRRTDLLAEGAIPQLAVSMRELSQAVFTTHWSKSDVDTTVAIASFCICCDSKAQNANVLL
jgi:hypothetical protein